MSAGRHQLTGNVVAASALNDGPIVHEELGPHCLQHLQRRLDDRPKYRMPVDCRAHARRELAAQAFGKDPTEGLQNAAHAILQRRDLRHDLAACYQQCTHGLAVKALHRHLAVPADAHDLCQTEGVVGVGLVDLERQRGFGVARIDADHGQANRLQLVEHPVRQLPAFESDPSRVGRVLLHSRCDSFRRRVGLAAPYDLLGIVNDADRRFLQRHIEADILLALGHDLAPWRCGEDQPAPAVVTPRLRHVPTWDLGSVARRHCQGWPLGHRRLVLGGAEHGATLAGS